MSDIANNVAVGTKRPNDETDLCTKKSRPNPGVISNTGSSTPDERLKRKMIALMLGYSGVGYYGMQRNPGVKTIEDDLLKALFKAGTIYEDHIDTPQNTRFQRSCRTDKGVSASRQIVSFRAGLVDDLVAKVNSYLPPQIRVFGYKRVTRNFNCKTACDFRTYSYMTPTFAFTPVEEITNEDYRMPDSVLEEVNKVLAHFKGTHNFHNFTAGRTANDASCQRYITEFECGAPFIKEGIEYVVIRVKGQSFMLHQIRKMIGLAIAIVRGVTSIETIIKAWCPHRIDIPIAPGLGLLLEEVHYDNYNERYGGDGFHEPLTWSEHNDEIDKFKETYIYPTVINTEKNEKSMLNWLGLLLHHTFDIREPSAPSYPLNSLGAVARSLKKLDQEASENLAANGNSDAGKSVSPETAAETGVVSSSNGTVIDVNADIAVDKQSTGECENSERTVKCVATVESDSSSITTEVVPGVQ